MSRGIRSAAVACVLALGFAFAPVHTAAAQVSTNTAPLEFRDAAEESRFHDLTAELRCVMCQNQSLADSDAQIAHDLRREVLDLMHQGKSDDEVVEFLVARYGEFVRYKPAVEPSTWLLWFGPGLLLIGGGILLVRVIRARSRREVPAPAEDQEW